MIGLSTGFYGGARPCNELAQKGDKKMRTRSIQIASLAAVTAFALGGITPMMADAQNDSATTLAHPVGAGGIDTGTPTTDNDSTSTPPKPRPKRMKPAKGPKGKAMMPETPPDIAPPGSPSMVPPPPPRSPHGPDKAPPPPPVGN